MRVDVDSAGYTSASSDFYECNHGIIDAVSTLNSAASDAGGMAGHDSGGQAWGAQYNTAANALIQAGCDLGEAMGSTGSLLNASLLNHQGADYGATIDTPPQYQTAGSDGDADPDHWIETLQPAALPSAQGGTGDQPGWWHYLVGHLEGLAWPDADTGRLRSVGQAWTTAGDSIAAYAYTVDAAKSQIQTQQSPEVADVAAVCDSLKKHTTDLSDAYKTLGQACQDYAKHVDDHHDEVESELKSFIAWTVVIEGVGAVAGFFTLGLAEAAAQAGEAAEVANAAVKVVRILKDLIELAHTVAATIEGVSNLGPQMSADLKKFLDAKAVAALEKVAPALLKQELIDELIASGVKVTPANIIFILKGPDGKIVFLETGDEDSGLAHIYGEHKADFANKGVSKDEIAPLLQKALTEGTVVGYQGRDQGRPIYEVSWNGKMIRIAITVGSNGYVVGANPSG